MNKMLKAYAEKKDNLFKSSFNNKHKIRISYIRGLQKIQQLLAYHDTDKEETRLIYFKQIYLNLV